MIQAVFFDIGGTVHTQDATPESDRDYIPVSYTHLTLPTN